MRIHLEALPGEVVPEDTFVSVRVGDLRKLSQFTSSRSYNFPADSFKDSLNRCGFIEVYKRVGTTIIDFDDLDGAGGAQDMDVPCNQPGFEKLGLQVTIGEDNSEQPAKTDARRQDQRSRYRHRMEAVKQYMNHHNIEKLVSESVGHLLKDKPEDPRLMLSNYVNKYASLPPLEQEGENIRRVQLKTKGETGLMKSSKSDTSLLKPSGLASTMKLPKLPGDIRSASMLPARESIDPLAVTAKPVPSFVQMQPREVSSKAFASKPPELEPSHKPTPSPVSDFKAMSNSKFVFLPSVGSWLFARPASKLSQRSNDIALETCVLPAFVEEACQEKSKESSLAVRFVQTESRSEAGSSSASSSAEILLDQASQDRNKKIDLSDASSDVTGHGEVEEPDQEPDADYDLKEIHCVSDDKPSIGSWLDSQPDTPSGSGSVLAPEYSEDTVCEEMPNCAFPHKPSVGSWMNFRIHRPTEVVPDRLALQVEKVKRAEQERRAAETAAIEQARQAKLAALEAFQLSQQAEAARFALEFAMSDLDWAHQAAAKLEESRLAAGASLKQATGHRSDWKTAEELLSVQSGNNLFTIEEEVEEAKQVTGSPLAKPGQLENFATDLLQTADRLEAEAVDAKDPKAAEARLLRLCAQASKPNDRKAAEDRLQRLTAQVDGGIAPRTANDTAKAQHEDVDSSDQDQHALKSDEIQLLATKTDETVPPMQLQSRDIDSDLQSNVTSARSLVNAMVSGSFEQVASDLRPKSCASVSDSVTGARSDFSWDVGPPPIRCNSPCASSLASAFMFGATSALDDMRPEAYECSVVSMSTEHDRDDDLIIAMPRPPSQASGVSGTTVGDLPLQDQTEKGKQREKEPDVLQIDSLQQLRFQTIQELERERNEARMSVNRVAEDEREAAEVKVEMLDLALQDARAEYASSYPMR